MLYIVSQDGEHYSSSPIEVNGTDIMQDGMAVGHFKSKNDAKKEFERILQLHYNQINSSIYNYGVSDCVVMITKDSKGAMKNESGNKKE